MLDAPILGADKLTMEFLGKEAQSLGLKYSVHTYTKGYPIFVMTWEGSKPNEKSVLLNCHYDVVPVMREKWHWDPFAADELPNGDIVARGAQDMKCVCMQYLEAIRRLLAAGFVPERTVHVAFQPDEEMGGTLGMAKWVQSSEFAALNVGFGLDEGIASEDDAVTLFYGERTVWWLKLLAKGPTGHASRFIQGTAMEKLVTSVKRFFDFRAQQEALLAPPTASTSSSSSADSSADDGHSHAHHGSGCKHAAAKKLGDVVTLNLTVLQGGVSADGGKTWAINVIPQEAMAGFDVRIPPHIDLKQFEQDMRSWLEPDVEIEFVVKAEVNRPTSLDPAENRYWSAMRSALDELCVRYDPQVFPAATDGRYLRNVSGLPVLGFSPIRKQPSTSLFVIL